MARINLTLPDDLKRKMDDVSANWSAIAAVAFKKVVDLETLCITENAMNAVVLRLKKSKEEYEQEVAKQARELGQSWGAQHASFKHLKQLDRLHGEGMAFSGWHQFCQILGIDADYGARAAAQDIADDADEFVAQAEEDGFMDEFVEGALQVFHEVQDKLD